MTTMITNNNIRIRINFTFLICVWLKTYSFDLSNSIRLLQISDWGGKETAPFCTNSQVQTAVAMANAAQNISADFVIALGDNFYKHGITVDKVNRFETTWDNIYINQYLQIPWYLIAGNHDHRGNVTKQIEFSNINKRWNFPSLYYKRSFQSEDKSVSLDIIMIDTTTYTGHNSGEGYNFTPEIADHIQHDWIENELKNSQAQYIILGSHYPVYSVCEHGLTIPMVNHLRPLLEKYNATSFSGHDHCAEHLIHNDVNYFLNGIGNGCCYQPNRMMDSPSMDSLKYLMSNTDMDKQIDDDITEIGVNGTIGGFSTLILTSKSMKVTFYNQLNEELYTAIVLPRDITTLSTSQSTSVTSSNTIWFYLSAYIFMVLLFAGCALIVRRNRSRGEGKYRAVNNETDGYEIVAFNASDDKDED